MTAVQTFVQRRFHTLLLLVIGLGFVVLIAELLEYKHYQGAQIIGLASTVLGAIAVFLGITAAGGLRRILIGVLVLLSLVGLFGVWEHNEDRITGEERDAPPAGQTQSGNTTNAAPAGGDAMQAPPDGDQGGGPPPALAPLSVSGLCIMGALVLLGRKEYE